VSCAGTPLQSTSAPTPVISSGPTTPLIQSLDGDATGAGQVANDRASVLGDPTARTMPIWIGELGTDGQLVDPATLKVRASSTNSTVFPDGSITITGTGSNRTVAFDPPVAGNAIVTLTVTDANGNTSASRSLTFTYYVTATEMPTSRALYGNSDASTAI